MKILPKLLISMFCALVVSCGEKTETFELKSFFLNGSEIQLKKDEYRYHNETVYFSFTMLEYHMYFHFQEIVPGKQIGMCAADNCIPFSLNKNNKEDAFKEGEEYFIPVLTLIEMANGTGTWDKETRKLEISYTLPEK